MPPTVEIGVIGGSGLYQFPEITDVTPYTPETPFGRPSAELLIGTLRGKRVAFLARHGAGHLFSPAAVPYRANLYALKQLGVRFIIGVNACGSLREDYAPGHLVILDQVFDYIIGQRDRSFFDQGVVAHVSVADPFCNELRELTFQAVQSAGGTVHARGTLLVEDGPRFATRAESHIFRQWGCDLIGMTTVPEVFLAREAEIAYAAIAHITDYDVWHESEEAVTADKVMAISQKNLATAQAAIANLVENLDLQGVCACHRALDNAVVTARDKISDETVERLRPILTRVLGLSHP